MADQHSSHGPPGLPPVHDEAADTPLWVPVVGLVLLVLLALGITLSAELGSGTSGSDAQEPASGSATAQAESPGAGSRPQ